MGKLPPRVLITCERYYPEGTGGSFATHLIVKKLANHVRLTVLTSTRHPEKVYGVKYVIMPYIFEKTKYHIWLNQLLTLNIIRKLIEKHDVIYITDHSYPLIPFAKNLRKRVIVHLHDYQPISPSSVVLAGSIKRNDIIRNNLYYEIMQRRGLAKVIVSSALAPVSNMVSRAVSLADRVIFVSKRQMEIIIKHLPEIKSKSTVIYNLPPNDISITEKEIKPTLFYAGGDNIIKGIHLILHLLKILDNHKNMEFFVVGRSRDHWQTSKLHILEKIEQLHNTIGIKFLNWLPRKNYLNILAKSWSLLFPSICEEPFPYAVLEAALSATIPIAADVGGIREIVGNTPAEKMLFAPGKPDELLDRIEEVLSLSKEEVSYIGSELREIVLTKFDAERIQRRLISVMLNEASNP